MQDATTPVERLISLFASHPHNRTRDWGSRNLAILLGVDAAVITRWRGVGKRGKHGRIPIAYNHRIIQAADEYGISRTLLRGILDDGDCPTCGAPVGAETALMVRP